MKKKIPKSVLILTVFLIILCILPFILPNPAMEKLKELERKVIEPHLNNFLEDYEITRVNVDRYLDTEDTRTYEVFVNLEVEPTIEENETYTYSPSTARYIIVIKNDEEVVSTTQ